MREGRARPQMEKNSFAIASPLHSPGGSPALWPANHLINIFIPKGFLINQPRVARHELPWVAEKQIYLNPEWVESNRQRSSIPNIPFIEFNFVAFQQLPEFLLKR